MPAKTVKTSPSEIRTKLMFPDKMLGRAQSSADDVMYCAELRR